MGKGNVGTNLSDANFKNISNRFSQKNFERKFLILDDSHISGSLKHTGTSNLICICYSGTPGVNETSIIMLFCKIC